MTKPIIRRFAELIGFAILSALPLYALRKEAPCIDQTSESLLDLLDTFQTMINVAGADVGYSRKHTGELLNKNVGLLCRCSINTRKGIALPHRYPKHRIYLFRDRSETLTR